MNATSQNVCDTLPFLNCEANQIIVNNPNEIDTLIQKFNNLNEAGSSSINIVHIGDSHLQAGFLTEKIKQELFNYYCKDSIVSPGFIFPFTIAQTNNPFFYKVNYTGNWEYCKNVDYEKTCRLGLSGITVRTQDSVATFSIKMQNKKDSNNCKKYLFDQIKIFHNNDSSIALKINGQKISLEKNISEINLTTLTDSVHFEIINSDTTSFFELYGIILENSSSKINYHTIGVNGATAQSYLKCEYLSPQLSSINPDLVIISLGTNEAFDDHFSILEHEYVLKDLVLQIKDTAPNAAIVLVTPNDHLKRGQQNEKVLLVRKNIIKISKELHLSLWDFYTIMGGANSINDWYNKGLTGEDKLHFKRKGYEIQGELFTKAFIDLIEKTN